MFKQAYGDLPAALSLLSGSAIFFGHQSVGGDIIRGIEEFCREAAAGPRIVETDRAQQLGPGVFGHARIGVNGDPLSKLLQFEHLMRAGMAERLDFALMKLCYADIGPATDALDLAFRYQAMLDRLSRRFPGTVFIAVTAPLTSRSLLRRLVRACLGRAELTRASNSKREDFNAVVRAGSRPVFDLARIEAMGAGREPFPSVPKLNPHFTRDGGHLNSEGRAVAAAELLRLLAGLASGSRKKEASR